LTGAAWLASPEKRSRGGHQTAQVYPDGGRVSGFANIARPVRKQLRHPWYVWPERHHNSGQDDARQVTAVRDSRITTIVRTVRDPATGKAARLVRPEEEGEREWEGLRRFAIKRTGGSVFFPMLGVQQFRCPARLQQRGSPLLDQDVHLIGRSDDCRDWQALSVHGQAQFTSVWIRPGFTHGHMSLNAFRLRHGEANS